jgi:hypothetical protein
LNTEAGFVASDVLAALPDLARAAISAGQTFSAWVAEMVQRFGEAIRDYLAGAWQAARKTSQVGAVNLAPSPISSTRAGSDALAAGTGRESQFGERVQQDMRLTPELRATAPGIFEVQSQQAATDVAAEMIRTMGRDAAAAAFRADRNLPMTVRISGLMQVVQQYDALAALQSRQGDAAGANAFDSLLEQAVEAKADLEALGNEAGRNLAMFNTWARLSPDGILRASERAWTKKNPGMPYPMSAETREKVRGLAEEVQRLPEGTLRQMKVTELLNEIALAEGIPAADVIMAAWYANILSGLSTQGVNIYGNGFQSLLRGLAVALASPRDAVRFLKGAWQGLEPGFREARAMLREGVAQKNLKYDDSQKATALELMTRQGPMNAGQWLAWVMSLGGLTRYVFRAMGAADAIFWHTAQEAMAHVATARVLRKDGLRPGTPAFNAEVIRQLGGDESVMVADMAQAERELREAGQPVTQIAVNRRSWELRSRRRKQEVQDASTRWADRITYQQDPEGVGRLVSRLISAVQDVSVFGLPLGRAMVPFNRIVSNIFESNLDFFGVGILRGMLGAHLSDVRMKGGKLGLRDGAIKMDDLERRERMMAGAMGLTVGGVLLALSLGRKDEDDETVDFMLYGSGPKDKAKREQMPRGWRPYTLKVGDTYYSYAETPLNFVMGALGGWMDSTRYEGKTKTDEERAYLALLSAMRAMSSQGVLSSVADFLKVATGETPPNSLKKTAVAPVKGFIGAQGLLRDTSTLWDDNKIDDASIYASLVKDLPYFKSVGTRPALNAFGEPVKVDGLPVVRRFATGQKTDPESNFMGRHQLRLPAAPTALEIGQYLPREVKASVQRRALQMTAVENGMLTPDQMYGFHKRQGQLIKEGVVRLRRAFEPNSQKPATEQTTEQLQKRIAAITLAARRQAMLEIVQKLE